PYLQYIGWLLNIYKLTNKIHTNFIHNRNLIRCSIALQRLPLLVSFHKGFQISGLVFHDIPTSINPLIDHYCSLFPLIFHLAFLIFSFLFLILLPSRTTLVYTVLHSVYAHTKYPRNRFLHLAVHKNREL